MPDWRYLIDAHSPQALAQPLPPGGMGVTSTGAVGLDDDGETLVYVPPDVTVAAGGVPPGEYLPVSGGTLTGPLSFAVDGSATTATLNVPSVSNNSFYLDYAAPHPAVVRLGDRVTIGATNSNNLTSAPGSTASWVGTVYGAGYIERDATLSAYSNAAGYAIAGAARSSDWKNTSGFAEAYALTGFSVADAANSVAEGVYLETHLNNATSRSWAIEMEVVNLGGPVPTTNPYSVGTPGSAGGIVAGAGGDPTYVTGTLYDNSTAFSVSGGYNQNAKWRKGIVFGAASLTGTNGADAGNGVAINLARNHSLRWDTGANNPESARIQSIATGQAQFIVFSDTGMQIQRADTGAVLTNASSSGWTANVPVITAGGLQIGPAPNTGYTFDGPTASYHSNFYTTAGANRWAYGMDNAAESGGTTGLGGGNFFFRPYDNSGTAQANALTVQRNGQVSTSGALTAGGGLNVNGANLIMAANMTIQAAPNAGVTWGAGGPTIRSGAGAATGTQPAGSLWLRTDGATGARLYVSAGAGTWNAVAGV